MDIEVTRGSLDRWRVVDGPEHPLAAGEARLRIDGFGFSSNNVTYAVVGDLLRYWEFFPAAAAEPGDDTRWGRVPAWGFAEVTDSRSPDVAPGERLFGFVPMSTELVIVPGRSNPSTVTDVSRHRADLPGPYNALRRCAADPAWRADREELQMLLFPLFFTSFVIDDYLADRDDLRSGPVIITSASAKTSVGLAHLLHRRGRPVVGLTSAANSSFCRSLGVYDDVCTYDDLTGVDADATVLVDVAGNRDVVAAVHALLGDGLVHSMVVGDTHWDHRATVADGGLPGPRPEFFFAPSQVTKRTEEWGADELGRRMAEAWSAFAEWIATWLVLEHAVGPEAVIDVFRTYLSGRVDPRRGTICRLGAGEVPV